MTPLTSTPFVPASDGDKPFLYLVQGKGPLPDHYADLVSPGSDVIHLTWGEPVEGAVYFPKSSWTEGRNRLLQEALARPEQPLYYIFLDDDVVFEKGDWRLFEDELLTHRPAIAAPYYPEYALGEPVAFKLLPDVKAQTLFWFDAIYTAFHRDIIEDGILLPYHTGLDASSWVYSQWFVIMLARLLYPGRATQINRVWIANTAHNTDYEALGKLDFDMALDVLRTAVRSHSPLSLRVHDKVSRTLGLGGVKFIPRALRARRSYRLSSFVRRAYLRIDADFWADRRAVSVSSPLP